MAIRMTRCLHIVSIAFFSVVLFVLPPAILLAAGGPSAEVTYFELYTEIIRSVDASSLDRSIGKKSRSLNTELQKEIIATDARLATLKAESANLEGAERDEVLDQLIAAGAEKERIYLFYRQQLAQLLGHDKQDTVALRSPSTGKTTDKKSAEMGKSTEENQPESQPRSIRFTSIPEDVTSGEFD